MNTSTMVPVLAIISTLLLSSGGTLSKGEHNLQVRQAQESCSIGIEEFTAAHPHLCVL